MSDNPFVLVGRRTAAAMRAQDPQLAKHYDAAVQVISSLPSDQQVALLAIVKHTLEHSSTLRAAWEHCPSLRQLEMERVQ